MQKINNIVVQSEQLKHNGRIPELNRSIRSLHKFQRAGSILLGAPAQLKSRRKNG